MAFGKDSHLHLIDGSAYIFRAYHALPPLTRKSDGLPVGALVFAKSGCDEVLLAFMHGDMAEPVVLGGLYNGTDQPPAHKDHAQQDQKLWRTKAGHQVLLDDGSSTRQVALVTAGGHQVVLDDQHRQLALTTAGGHAVTLDDQRGRIAIETSAGLSVTLDDSGQQIELKAGAASITLGATGSIKIQGTEVTVSAASIKLG